MAITLAYVSRGIEASETIDRYRYNLVYSVKINNTRNLKRIQRVATELILDLMQLL